MPLVDPIYKTVSKMPATLKIPLSRMIDKIPNSWMYGTKYRKAIKDLYESEKLTQEEIEIMQFGRLKDMVSMCFEKSTFYRELYQSHGFHPAHLKDLSDIARIPVIDKFTIGERAKELEIPLKTTHFLSHTRTGGTTTSSMHFTETLEAKILERAFRDRFHKWHGLKEQDPKILLKGTSSGREAVWYYSPFLKAMVFPFWEISEQLLMKYSAIIEKIAPVGIILSYPSLVYAFSKAINDGIIPKPKSVKMIYCTAETLLTYQANEIQKAFGIAPVDHYGQNERVSIIEHCKMREYHIVPEYGITEILDVNNKPLTKENEIGIITATGFSNKAFPLIRYKTNDVATVGAEAVCSCGLPYRRIKRIEGRSGDFLRTDDGKSFSAPLIDWAIEDSKNIRDVQLIQKSAKDVEVSICPDKQFTMENAQAFLSSIGAKTDNRFIFHLKIVDEIRRPPNFKKRLIISEIDNHKV